MTYRYILEKYNGAKSRHTCPSCEKHRVFAKYIDTETGDFLPYEVGRCNREDKCSYHYTPKQYFENNNSTFTERTIAPLLEYKQKKREISYIDKDVLIESIKQSKGNNFETFLLTFFDAETTSNLLAKYYVGTSSKWNGATIFWQVDQSHNIRTGKIMLYDEVKGKRIKEPYNHISWTHTSLNQPEYNLQQCLFGEHLLINKIDAIALVESEKTAITCSGFSSRFIWLACGGLSNLTKERCKALKGRNVLLFPDFGCFDKWTNKAKELSEIMSINVSNLLEKSSDKYGLKLGDDLADLILKKNKE